MTAKLLPQLSPDKTIASTVMSPEWVYGYQIQGWRRGKRRFSDAVPDPTGGPAAAPRAQCESDLAAAVHGRVLRWLSFVLPSSRIPGPTAAQARDELVAASGHRCQTEDAISSHAEGPSLSRRRHWLGGPSAKGPSQSLPECWPISGGSKRRVLRWRRSSPQLSGPAGA